MTQTRLLFCRVAWFEGNGKEYEMTESGLGFCSVKWPGSKAMVKSMR